MSDLRIDIQSMNDRNTIQEKEYPEFDDLTALRCPTGGISASNNVRVLFEQTAVRTLFNHISWGKKYHHGDVEQAGILLGKYYRDRTTHEEIIWGDVLAVIPAESNLVCASFENIDITTQAWAKMYEDAEEYIGQGMQILGWYHTHLDYINTRFSALDRSTQKKSFTFEYSFGVVFNPNRKKWSAFYGPNSTECKGVLLLDDEAQEDHEENPQIKIKQVNGDSLLKEDGTILHLEDTRKPIPVRKKIINDETEDKETLGSVIGQFFTGLGGLIAGKTKKVKKGGNLYIEKQQNDSIMEMAEETQSDLGRVTSERIHGRKVDLVTYTKKRKDGPQIEILKTSENGEMMIKCKFYTFLPNGDFQSQPNSRFIIEKEMIDEILKVQPLETTKNFSIYGKMSHKDNNAILSLSQQEDANSRIIFGKDLEKKKIFKQFATGSYGACKAKVQFIVIIDEINNQNVDVKVVHCSRGDII